MKKFLFPLLTIGLACSAQASLANNDTHYNVAQLTPISQNSPALNAIVSQASTKYSVSEEGLENDGSLSSYESMPNTIFAIDAKELPNNNKDSVLKEASELKAPILISNYQPKQLKYLTKGFSARGTLALVYAYNSHDILVQTFNPATNPVKDSHTLKQTPNQIVQAIKNTLQKIQKRNQAQALKTQNTNPQVGRNSTMGAYARESQTWEWTPAAQMYSVPTSVVPANKGRTQCVMVAPVIRINTAAIPKDQPKNIFLPSKYMSMTLEPSSAILLETTTDGNCQDASHSIPSVWVDESGDNNPAHARKNVQQEGAFINWVGVTLGMPYSPKGTSYVIFPKGISSNHHGETTHGWILSVSNTETPVNENDPHTPDLGLTFSYQHPTPKKINYQDFDVKTLNDTANGHASWQYLLNSDARKDKFSFADWWKYTKAVEDISHCEGGSFNGRSRYLCPFNKLAYNFTGLGPSIAWHITNPTSLSQTVPLEYSVNVGLAYLKESTYASKHLFTVNTFGEGAVDLSIFNDKPFPTSAQDNPRTGSESDWQKVNTNVLNIFQAFTGSQTFNYVLSNASSSDEDEWVDNPIWELKNATRSPMSLLTIQRWNNESNKFETVNFASLFKQYPIAGGRGYQPYRLSFKGFGSNGEGESEFYDIAYALSLNKNNNIYSNSFSSGKSTYLTTSFMNSDVRPMNMGGNFYGAANTATVFTYANAQNKFVIGFDTQGHVTYAWTNDESGSGSRDLNIDRLRHEITLGSSSNPAKTTTPNGVSVLLEKPTADNQFVEPVKVFFDDNNGLKQAPLTTLGEDASYTSKTDSNLKAVIAEYANRCIIYNDDAIKKLNGMIVIDQNTKFNNQCPPSVTKERT